MRTMSGFLALSLAFIASPSRADGPRPFSFTPFGEVRSTLAAFPTLNLLGESFILVPSGTVIGGGARVEGPLGRSPVWAWTALGEYGAGTSRDVSVFSGANDITKVRERQVAVAAGLDARVLAGAVGVFAGPAAFFESATVESMDSQNGSATSRPFRTWGVELRVGLDAPLTGPARVSGELTERMGWGSATDGPAEAHRLLTEPGMRLGIRFDP